jgi:hypothetical protein
MIQETRATSMYLSILYLTSPKEDKGGITRFRAGILENT